MPDNIENQRDFKRYPLEFNSDVFTFSGAEKQLAERVVLKDISGGGACFVSNRPGHYAIGQQIALEICLPGTVSANARMQGQATVVWIDDMEVTKAGRPSRVKIGISMDDLLSFQQKPRDSDSGEEKPDNA